MRYVSTIGGSLVAFVFFVVAVLFVPNFAVSDGIEVVLTVSTFLFAILIGFFLSRINARFDEIRRLAGEEDAAWLAFYKTSQIFGTSFAKRIAGLMDDYYVVTYDFAISESPYKPTAPYYLKIWDEVRKIRKSHPQSAYQILLDQLTEIEKNRNGASIVAAERLSAGQWLVLLILSLLIIISLFDFRTGNIFFQFSVVLLSTTIVMILLIIRDMQNMIVGGKSSIEETGQEVLEFIGRKRYYNNRFIKMGVSTIPQFVHEYRLGLHEPGEKKFNIRTVKR